MGVIERISDVADDEFKYLVENDYRNNGLDVGRLMRANIFLESIKKFYHQRLSEENFSELKAKWLKNTGNQA